MLTLQRPGELHNARIADAKSSNARFFRLFATLLSIRLAGLFASLPAILR
jgi:hypothetical protein